MARRAPRDLVLLCAIIFAAGCGEASRAKNRALPDEDPDAGELDGGAGSGGGTTEKDGGIIGPEDLDDDGDGYTTGKGDCDDKDPLVNPGAFEYVGNGRDDDCDGQIDNPYVDCDDGSPLQVASPKDAAQAMNLCPAKFVIGASYAKANIAQRAIRTSLGPSIKPRAGKTMLMLSSGKALAPGEAGFVPSGTGSDFGTASQRPVTYASTPKCGTATGSTVYDMADLALELKAPTNARAFRFDIRFFSGEYPQYHCSQFNDAFAAVMKGSKYPTPKNVAHDESGEFLSVNVAFWTTCENIPTYMGCKASPKDVDGSGYGTGDLGGPHGSTAWVTTSVPISPGEKFSLRLAVWDEGDAVLDSAVLLDGFAWDVQPTDKEQETTVPQDPK